MRPEVLAELPWRARHPDTTLRLSVPTVRPVKTACDGTNTFYARKLGRTNAPVARQTAAIYLYGAADPTGEKLEKALHILLVGCAGAVIVTAAFKLGALVDNWPSFMALVRDVIS